VEIKNDIRTIMNVLIGKGGNKEWIQLIY
jgi:hypothetical protein